MTVYDKQYTFTHTHPHLPPKRHTHPNPPKPEKYKLPDYNHKQLMQGIRKDIDQNLHTFYEQ